MARLEAYAALLERWQERINLVAASTLPDLWRRHMLDSAQLLRSLPDRPCSILDLGSGAGFPGLVLAMLGAGPVTLTESDQRKCAFLAEAIRLTGAPASLHRGRIEDLPAEPRYDVVTARALAPLAKLLGLAERRLRPGGVCLFLKGRGADEELTLAAKEWKMRVERNPSESDPGGWILRVGEITRVRAERAAR